MADLNVPLLLALSLFLVISLFSFGILIHLNRLRQRKEVIRKIREMEAQDSVTEKESQILELSKPPGNVLMRFLNAIGGKANPGRTTEQADIKLKFSRAGLRGKNAPAVFWGIKCLLAVVLPVTFLIITTIFFKAMDKSHILYFTILLSLLGLFLPNYWLMKKTSKRREKIVKGFPDALDLLVVCVEAGMGLDAGMHRVGVELESAYPELSDELKLLNLELRAGKSRHSALRNLAERTGVDDIKSFVTLLIQTDRFGTSVAQALRVYAEGFRTARYQKAEELAAKIGTKLIFPLVMFIFPAMIIVILGPVAILVRRTFYG